MKVNIAIPSLSLNKNGNENGICFENSNNQPNYSYIYKDKLTQWFMYICNY